MGNPFSFSYTSVCLFSDLTKLSPTVEWKLSVKKDILAMVVSYLVWIGSLQIQFFLFIFHSHGTTFIAFRHLSQPFALISQSDLLKLHLSDHQNWEGDRCIHALYFFRKFHNLLSFSRFHHLPISYGIVGDILCLIYFLSYFNLSHITNPADRQKTNFPVIK